MQVFQEAKNFIKILEGCQLQAYQDSATVWTIGFGNTAYLKHFKNPRNIVISQSTADQLLNSDLTPVLNAVMSCVVQTLKPNQYASLCAFAFNVGITAFQTSTLLKIINANPNNLNDIKVYWLKWDKITVNGEKEVCLGLQKRRLKEFEFYCS